MERPGSSKILERWLSSLKIGLQAQAGGWGEGGGGRGWVLEVQVRVSGLGFRV